MTKVLHTLKSLILSGFFIFLAFSLQAQQYTFINYSTEQGLAQSQVSAMVQDKHGYLWFATFGGLSRFDGIEFVNFTELDGLIENQLYSVFIDSKNKMWIGGIGGFSVYNGLSFSKEIFPEAYQSYNVISISESPDGSIWFALEGGGLARKKGSSTVFYGQKEGLDENVRTVFCDRKGDVWAGTQNGLFLLNEKKTPVFDTVKLNGEAWRNISSIAEDKNGLLWIGTYDEGVFHETETGGYTNYTIENGLINNGVRTVFIDSRAQVWFGTKTGISKFDGRRFKSFSSKEGLINNNIKFIGEDTEGNIWFGTDGKGILKLAGEAFVTYTTNDGLSSDFVMSIAEDHTHALWFATYGEGVVKLENGEFTRYTDENGLSNNTVWSIAVGKDNRIWFGTSVGLTVFDKGKFTSYFEEDGLLSDRITSLYVDRDGSIWIGSNKGLSRFKDDKFENFSAENGFNGNNVRNIYRDGKGVLWLGTFSGLYGYDGKKFSHYRYDVSNTDNTIYTIVEDAQHDLWIGSKDGLYLFREGKFIRVPLGESVNSNTINFIIFENWNLWIGTNNGIYELNAKKFSNEGITEFRNYSRLEGVRGLETNMNACFRDSHGRYWFGTDGGLVQYDPSKRLPNGNQIQPYIIINNVRLFFDDIDWKKFGNDIDSSTGFSRNTIFPYNKNHFTFDFTGICHSNPNKVRYKFMLEGFDTDWSPITDSRSITYSNLPSGAYTFKVIACNDNGIWSDAPASFSFTIRPPFWFTWWFYLLCTLFVFSLGYLVYRWRIAVIRRNAERDQLIYKSKLLTLEQQTLNASMNRHFIFNALNSIQYYINKQDKLEANRYLTSFAKLIRKNLDSSSSGNLVTLNEELERLELYLSLENMRFKNKFQYELFIDEEIDTEAIMIPPMLLQPYVENSIWHGILPMEKEGTIWVRIEPNDEKSVRIKITDNGIGITTSLKSKGKYGADHVSRGIQITTGRLAVLKKLTNENLRIEGPYEVKNQDGTAGGTEVTLVIPGAGMLVKENFSENPYD